MVSEQLPLVRGGNTWKHKTTWIFQRVLNGWEGVTIHHPLDPNRTPWKMLERRTVFSPRHIWHQWVEWHFFGAIIPGFPLPPQKKTPKMATGPSLSAYRRGSNASHEPPTFHLNKGMSCWDQWISWMSKKTALHRVNVISIGINIPVPWILWVLWMSCWHYRI